MASDISNKSSATDVGQMWKNAVRQYESIVKVDMDSLRDSVSLDQILTHILDAKTTLEKNRHDGSNVDKFRSLVYNSLVPIQKLGELVAQATKATFPPSEAIFAAVRYLIHVANSVSGGYDKVTSFFEDLDSYLNQLKVLEHNIPPLPELQKAITEVFASVLNLCGICAKYVKKKRFAIIMRNLITRDDTDLKAAYDTFHQMVRREQGVVRNAILAGVEELKLNNRVVCDEIKGNMALTQTITKNAKTLLRYAVDTNRVTQGLETAQESDGILTWLSSLDFHEKQRAVFAKHQNGTGNWLLNTSQFQDWFSSVENSVLWCPGIAGAGKSVMMSMLVNHVDEHTERSEVAVAYVYCDYKDVKTQSETGLLSSIVRQIVEQSKPMPQVVKIFRDKHAEKRRYPTTDEKISLIESLCGLFKKTFVFVDALDECAELARHKFLGLLKKLVPFIRLFITSRPHLSLETVFPELSCLHIAAQDEDIQIYLQSEIETNARLCAMTTQNPSLREDISRNFREKADGMFLLVHLQTLHLSGLSTPTQIRRALRSMHTGVSGFYDEAFRRVELQSEVEQATAKKALFYIYRAERPLHVDELRHALSVEFGTTELDRDNLPTAETLFNISAGLIRVENGNLTISFVHYTLQEYLEANIERLFPDLEMDLAMSCLTYMSFDSFGLGPCEDDASLDKRLEKYCFLDYASRHFGHHATNYQLDPRLDSLAVFLGDEKKVSSLVQVIHASKNKTKGWHDCFPRQFGPLHVASFWGLGKIISAYLDKNVDVNCQDSYGRTALQLAAYYGHSAVVNLLVDRGAEVNTRNKKGESALYWAVRNCHVEIVNFLLANGAQSTLEDHDSWTALDWAIIKGHGDIVRTMLVSLGEKESDQKCKALILAAEAGNETVIQLLLSYGAEVDWKDDQGSTALTWAVAEGHIRATLTLLQNGADVNSKDKYLNAPLHWALPYETVVKVLLEHGAHIDATNDSGQTALLWCAQDGLLDTLQLLLQHNAKVDTQDKHGFTALHAAALKKHEAMVRLLLANGANPNMLDRDGWTPLHAAALRSHAGVVELLLDKVTNGQQVVALVVSRCNNWKQQALLEHKAEKKSEGSQVVTGLRWAVSEGRLERVQAILDSGADIDAEDVGGWTALTVGAWMGQEVTVQLLLASGADVNKPERSGRSALHVASQDGYYDVAKVLVENGANVDAKIHGFTPLLLAAKNGHISIMELLIQQGAAVVAEDYHGRQALHWAAKYGALKVIKMLVGKRANMDATDRWGRTALMWAIAKRRLHAARLLLEHGASVHSNAADGTIALHLAAYEGDTQLVGQLLDRGADVEAKTVDGFTALHVAAFMGYDIVVQLLLGRGADARAKANRTMSGRSDAAGKADEGEEADEEEEGEGGVGVSGAAHANKTSFSQGFSSLIYSEGGVIATRKKAENGLLASDLAAGVNGQIFRRLQEHLEAKTD